MNKYRLFFAPVVIISALAIFTACQHEVSREVNIGTIIIPVFIEGATKVSLDADNGSCTWVAGDPIGIFVTGPDGPDNYYKAGVSNGAVRLSLESGQSRAKWAVYPYSSVSTADFDTPYVLYPVSYDMIGKNSSTYSYAPMVANNTQDALEFYHVGGVLQLTVENVPSATSSLEVNFTFTDETCITGVFSVDNPGQSTASTSFVSDGGNTVTFTNLTRPDSGIITLNIPLPTQDYSHLTGITITSSGGVSSTTGIDISGWSTISHGQGKKCTANFVSVYHLPGYTGKFRGYYISKGFLKWDDVNNAYTLTDEEDPLVLLTQYGKSASAHVYYHVFNYSNYGYVAGQNYHKSLKFRLDGYNKDNENIISNNIVIDGRVWHIPTSEQMRSWYYTDNNNTPSGSKLNGASNAKYTRVLVDLSTATDVNGIDYSEKGLTTSTGGTGTGTQYQAGLILIPDYVSITYPGLQANGGAFTSQYLIPWTVLKKFIEGGCIFLPAAGSLNSSGGSYGYYWSSSRYSSSNQAYYFIFQSSGSNATVVSYNYSSNAHPVVLVRE